jgi:hypothetical protein
VAKISNTPRDQTSDWLDHTKRGPSASISPHARIGEIANILAAGLMRLVARKSSPIFADTGDSSLDFSATESGHPTPVKRRISDG